MEGPKNILDVLDDDSDRNANFFENLNSKSTISKMNTLWKNDLNLNFMQQLLWTKYKSKIMHSKFVNH